MVGIVIVVESLNDIPEFNKEFHVIGVDDDNVTLKVFLFKFNIRGSRHNNTINSKTRT